MVKAYNLDNIEASFLEYLSAVNSNLGPTSIKNYLSDFKHFIGWIRTNYSKLDVSESITSTINEESLRNYLQYLSSQDLPIKTLSRRLSTLRKFIQFGEDNDLNLLISPSVLTQSKSTIVKNSLPTVDAFSISQQQYKKSRQFFGVPKIIQLFGMAAVVVLLLTYVPTKISNLLSLPAKPSTGFPSTPIK